LAFSGRDSRNIKRIRNTPPDTIAACSKLGRPTSDPVEGIATVLPESETKRVVPAFVGNGRLDILAASQLGYALYSPVHDDPARPANLARFAFLDNRSRDFYRDWEAAANTAVALLRAEAARSPYDRGLTDLVGELVTRSETFPTRWAAHNVRLHLSGTKRLTRGVGRSAQAAAKAARNAIWRGRPILTTDLCIRHAVRIACSEPSGLLQLVQFEQHKRLTPDFASA